MVIKNFIIKKYGLIRKNIWAQQKAKPFLAQGFYIISEDGKNIKRSSKISLKIFLKIILLNGFYNRNKRGTAENIFFSTNATEMRLMDYRKKRVITIAHSAKRSDFLFKKRSTPLPLPTPKILERINDFTFSEQLIKSCPYEKYSFTMVHNLIEAYFNFYKKLSKKDPEKIMQHGDLHIKNVLWRDEKPLYFIDIEDVGKRWYLYDLMIAISHEALTTGNWKLLDAFFNGEFDDGFQAICSLFNESLTNDSKFKFLFRALSERYSAKDFLRSEKLNNNYRKTIERYKNYFVSEKRSAFSTSNEPPMR